MVRKTVCNIVYQVIKSLCIEALHYGDVVMGTVSSQITSLTIVYTTVYSGADQRKHQSSASLAFVREIHRGPVNSPHKWPVTRKMFPFGDVIMNIYVGWLHFVVLKESLYFTSQFTKICSSKYTRHDFNPMSCSDSEPNKGYAINQTHDNHVHRRS